ncbi:stage II sporulation protein D [Cohnella nanjingensis]|uniref:Stage II sporulation protein D n=1 Tax=Cohnella nanjingensis TaxID=1387779 RepID=A0A7X0VEU4_9BACL|nr:stage II sporulation protein D [Cohnella nanjingensis]MBB6670598.1 stage II sporulation protein D [Cohnella nanjingensis]
MRIRTKRKNARRQRLAASAFTGGVAMAGILWLVLHAGTGGERLDASALAETGAGWPGRMDVQNGTGAAITGETSAGGAGGAGGAVAPGGAGEGGKAPAASGQAGSAGGAGASAFPSVADVKPSGEESPILVRVYLTKEKRVERVPLEAYVRGVVAAEMPASFEPAALEAQAIAARTYLLRRLWLNDRTGVPVRGADVTDTVTHQVYRSADQMDQLKRNDADGWAKVEQAVRQTRGLVLVYGGAPIEALYFSASNGYTENSKEVFPMQLPYLQVVDSPWDKEDSPRAKETVEMSLSAFYRKLGVQTLATLTGVGKRPAIRIDAWTEGHRVRTATVGGKQLTGDQIRKRLGLRSAAFDWAVSKNQIVITTYGSGHGVGMSQWGAEGMAKAGATAEQIVSHYYTGAQIKEVSKLRPEEAEPSKL